MMKLILATAIFVLWPSSAHSQDAYPPLKSLRDDYHQVSLVAHARVQKIEVADEWGGYYLYLVHCQVIKPLKGDIQRGQSVDFYQQVEKGDNMGWLLGEKVVFLYRTLLRMNNKCSLFALENSTLPYSAELMRRMKRIKSTRRRARKERSLTSC